ncbi:PREDICTED: uncharacterized protein LOC105962672 [Erythranthe guttata]|uniref:uncharacterized protein LOC105962672 n=1 Tax=Erythranthe guttata TaxID=4155 RepID=UPI00064DB0E1|nr:PREDICTED: uncharacterized protein LOC105962672 [Erythranthe guttata]|eukprot:XP_012842439.1 PREDICTED: uncharacterized protein LOC105962672 [Erythranthe guttata]
MKMFIKSIDERAWRAIITGWTPPMVKGEDKMEVFKPEADWSDVEILLANYNSRALNAIFSGVDDNQFKLIASCESAKRAWEILQVTYEGTSTVRTSKLQMLATKFENLKMEENETITDFHAKLCDISNESYALGEPYSESKLVRKAMRSLPERFAYRIAAIEEVRDVDTLKLDELMGKLLAQELNHGENHREKPREKKIAFQAETSYATPQNSSTQEDEQTVEESLAILSKNFGKFLKKIGKRGNFPSTGKTVNFQNSRRNSNQDNSEESKPRRIQCRECEGFGHIQSECANTLKKKKKISLTTVWSDEEESDDDQGNNDQVTNFVAFSSKVPLDNSESTVASTVATDCETESRYENMCSDYDKNLNENSSFAEDPNSSSDEEEPTLDEVKEVYEKMYQKWLDVVKVNNFLEKEKFVLIEENKTLKVRISTLEERIISSDQEKNSLQAKLTQTQEAIAKLNLGRGNLDEILSNNKPNYNRLGIGGSQLPKVDLKRKEDQNRKINFVKQASVSQTVATVEATKHHSKKSGCSRHMTGVKEFLKNYQQITGGAVTFGNGKNGTRASDNCYILVSAGPLEEEPTKELENSSSVAPTVPTVDAASTISEESDVNSETGDEAEVRSLELDDQTHTEPSRRVKKNHPVDQVIGSVEKGIQTRGFSDADWAANHKSALKSKESKSTVMGKRKSTGGSSSSSKRQPSRPATASSAAPPPRRRSDDRPAFEEPLDAVPLAFWEPPLLLTAASAENFGP